MKAFYLLIFLHFYLSPIAAQPTKDQVKNFYEFSYKSTLAYWYKNNPKLAIEMLDSAKQYLNLKPYQFLLLADYYLEIEDTMEAIYQINNSILKGVPIENICNRYEFLTNSKFKNEFNLTISNYEINRKKHLNTINVDFLILFREIYAQDQLIRNKPFSNDKIFIEYLNTVDSLNFVKFKNLVKKYGFPGHTEIGYYADITPIISHWTLLNNETFQYLDSLMLQAIFKGNFEPIDYAWIIDRRQLFGNLGPAIYGGTWPEEEYEIIGEINSLDVRRKLIFLPTLEDDSKITGRKLPIQYIQNLKK